MSNEFLSSKNFKSRLFTGIALGVVVILSLITPNAFLFRILFFGVCAMAVLELYMAHRNKVLFGIVVIDDRALIVEYVFIIIAVYAISTQLAVTDIWLVLVGAIASDTLAYFSGSALHGVFFKKRPFPKTSPTKSWEGIIGGTVGCIICLLGVLLIIERPLSTGSLVFIFLCPVFSIFGDYFASFCKRMLTIKDSNECIMESNLTALKFCERFMSGHGGYLDRIDSIAMVSCLMFFIRAAKT